MILMLIFSRHKDFQLPFLIVWFLIALKRRVALGHGCLQIIHDWNTNCKVCVHRYNAQSVPSHQPSFCTASLVTISSLPVLSARARLLDYEWHTTICIWLIGTAQACWLHLQRKHYKGWVVLVEILFSGVAVFVRKM